jgi:beta-lactamase class A
MSDFLSIMRKFFRMKVPSYLYLATIAILAAAIFRTYYSQSENLDLLGAEAPSFENAEHVSQVRLNDYDLIKPLLFTESPDEDPSLVPARKKLNEAINSRVAKGELTNASIYLKRLNDTRCIKLNPAESYNPGSMMKLPVMIAYYKEAMADAGILDKKLLFTGHNYTLPIEEGSVTTLEKGKSYPVKHLIDLMIVESDNDAMALLVNDISPEKLLKMFADLSIPTPTNNSSVFNLTPDIYSRFLRVLYNATYLDRKHSQLALSILTQTKYAKGITRSLDKKIKVAHKYGISQTNEFRSLSEAAIIYTDNPYLLVIMTKGGDYIKLADVIDECASIVHKEVR